jgi:hypothetical protein
VSRWAWLVVALSACGPTADPPATPAPSTTTTSTPTAAIFLDDFQIRLEPAGPGDRSVAQPEAAARAEYGRWENVPPDEVHLGHIFDSSGSPAAGDRLHRGQLVWLLWLRSGANPVVPKGGPLPGGATRAPVRVDRATCRSYVAVDAQTGVLLDRATTCGP